MPEQRQPEGNGVAERFIRTLTENFLWVRTFDKVAELCRGLRDFVADCPVLRAKRCPLSRWPSGLKSTGRLHVWETKGFEASPELP